MLIAIFAVLVLILLAVLAPGFVRMIAVSLAVAIGIITVFSYFSA